MKPNASTISRSPSAEDHYERLYGVLGTSACRFFDPRLASSITMRGHAIMRQTKALIEAKGYDVIYGDTDSTFVWLKRPHSEARAAEIGRELVSDVNARWAQEFSKASLPAPRAGV